ncbi:MAG: hypothetical protein ACK5QW_07535, partial [Cyanobacteriota bacterium]
LSSSRDQGEIVHKDLSQKPVIAHVGLPTLAWQEVTGRSACIDTLFPFVFPLATPPHQSFRASTI